MSTEDKQVLKQKFRTAQKLIDEKRYDAARHVLEQINHPQAQEWLKQIAGKTSKSTSVAPVSGTMIVFGLIVVLLIFGLIFGLMFLPALLESVQQNIYAPNETEIFADEIRYANAVSYCTYFTGYGDEYCLDWADLLVREYTVAMRECLDPYMQTVIFEAADYETIGACLAQRGVPPPL